MLFTIAVGLVGLVAAAIASVVGFGIGSLLTPLLALRVGTRLAVAAVSIPHFLATLLRFWRLRRFVDRRVLLGFGVASAVGGLTGALLHSAAGSRLLAIVFGLLLIFVGVSELSGLARRIRFAGIVAWIAGGVSGLFGGLVGNQGGIRSAALLGFDVPKEAFVATATAVGVIVDLARMPVYFVTQASGILHVGAWVAAASVGTIAGTLLGERVLRRVPERLFRRIVAVLVLALGSYMVLRGGG